MKLIPRTLGADKLTFTADTTKIVDLPRNHRIQRILLELTGTYDTSGTPGITDDDIYALVKAIRVRRNGTDPVRNLPLKYVAMMNYFDYGRRLEKVYATTASQADAAFRVGAIIDFRRNRRNPFDVVGALDAKRADSLKLEVDWGKATDIGSGVSDLQNVELKATLFEAIMDDTEERRLYPQGRDLLEYQTYNTKTVDAAYGDYTFPVNVPSGNLVEKLMLVGRKAGVRSDALIDRFKVKQYSPFPIDLQDWDWKSSQLADRLDYGLRENVAGDISWTGVTVIDFEDVGHLDMRGAKEGDAKILMTTQAPSGTTDVVVVSREWIPQHASR